MAAALLSPSRVREKRRRVRWGTSGRTIYAYVGGDPVLFAEEVSGWIIKKGNCFTYLDDFSSGSTHSTPSPAKPMDAVAAFHTHTLAPHMDERRLNFSVPGSVVGRPDAGDLSSANQNYYGTQYVGGNLYGGSNSHGRVISIPKIFRNIPPSKRGIPINMREPVRCECL